MALVAGPLKTSFYFFCSLPKANMLLFHNWDFGAHTSWSPPTGVWFVYMETIPLGAFPGDGGRAVHF